MTIEAAGFDPLDALRERTAPVSERGKLGQAQFLELMITQLRNQDPFKPMESGEFLGQLAQFGTVSGIAELKTSFEQLSGALVSSQALQASAIVGRNVLVPAETATLEAGAGLSGAVDLPENASAVTVGVYDQSGALVKTINLGAQPAGLVEINWDGRGEDSQALPAGTYTLRAEASFGAHREAVETLVSTRVDSVTMSAASGLMLNTSGLGQVSLADVRRIA